MSVHLIVVEEDATWPENTTPTRVASVFRVSRGKVTAALRLDSLQAALELAHLCREMAATECQSRARDKPSFGLFGIGRVDPPPSMQRVSMDDL